ncbi:hypothetical protein [Clostridium estertheticum]|uniref:hypothetical protein n=1 Tax=Clostridium estertheticum TaxID=238834 RepID=UPI001C7D21DE|nr:hypothetical protein [Clostridium estertheticum]MBX4267189.1 hypothetical protein [Clostridium estertheticum]WLC91311.1 hypothetical protein KTC95_23935 [Clostridium estertheticum]
MDFTLKKNKRKITKKVSEIKTNINRHGIVKGKEVTKVFEMKSTAEIKIVLSEIDSNVRVKLLINYSADKFYIFKAENKKLTSDIEDNELNSEEIASLLKSFYSNEKMQWDDCFLKNPKKMKYEMAPVVFEVKDNYLLNENKYINVISLEHLGDFLNIKNIIENNDCWLVIDCYKVDREYIFNKLDEMKKDNMIEKKFSSFISNKINDISYKLKEETIFQCEIKLLLYNPNLEQIRKENTTIKKNLLNNQYTAYTPQERINTRRLFEKCIYPNRTMDVIHSIVNKDLYKMIGSDK